MAVVWDRLRRGDGMSATTEPIEIPEMVMYCERCFSLGNCPPEARREQTTIDNPHASVLCGSCLREQGLEPLIVKLEGGN